MMKIVLKELNRPRGGDGYKDGFRPEWKPNINGVRGSGEVRPHVRL